MTKPRPPLIQAFERTRDEVECHQGVPHRSVTHFDWLEPVDWKMQLTEAARGSMTVTLIEPANERLTALESQAEENATRIAALEAAIKELRCEQLSLVDVELFKTLAEEWRIGRGHSSKIRDMAMHPAYQTIMAMGKKVVPLLLKEMEQRPSHWAWALRYITRANPVTDEMRGDLKAMAQAWIEWGKANGYRW